MEIVIYGPANKVRNWNIETAAEAPKTSMMYNSNMQTTLKNKYCGEVGFELDQAAEKKQSEINMNEEIFSKVI